MNWKQGGPWGNDPGDKNERPGGNNPWHGGRGNKGREPDGGGVPPDLEALMRESQERLRRMLPTGGGGRGFAVLGVILFVVWLATGFYRVQEGGVGVVLRFGEVQRMTQPGLRYHLPWPVETVEIRNVTFENRIEIGFQSTGYDGQIRDVPDESAMLTSDQNIVDLDFTVTWVIKDLTKFLFEIREPENTVKKAAESAIREVIGQTEIQAAITDARDRIQRDTRASLQTILDGYESGIEIVRVELTRVNPPEPVVDAFNDVQRAEADRERLRNEAEAYRNKIIPEARGEVERIKNEAGGYAEQVVNSAKGEADRFSKVWQAYQGSKDVTAARLYLETLEQILGRAPKIVLDSDGGAQNVLPYLPLTAPGARVEPAPNLPSISSSIGER